MSELPVNQILCGDCIQVMKELPKASVDLVVTSPPYWGLRDYGLQKIPSMFAVGGIGLEDHPNQYIQRLVIVARQIRRVLKKTGSFYLNLGDTYCGSGGAGGDYNKGGLREEQPKYKQPKVWLDPKLPARQRSSESTGFKPKKSGWLQPKQLMLIPSRVAITLQEDGWILRNDIVWYKPNHMPSSVKDRLTNSWEHVFHFVKSKRYFYDLDAIRKPHKISSLKRLSQDLTKQHGGPKGDSSTSLRL